MPRDIVLTLVALLGILLPQWVVVNSKSPTTPHPPEPGSQAAADRHQVFEQIALERLRRVHRVADRVPSLGRFGRSDA